MGAHEFAVGVHIEGIGDIDTDKADGTLFVSRDDPGFDGTEDFESYVAETGVPDVLTESFEVWVGDYETSSANIEIGIGDQAKTSKALVPTDETDETAQLENDVASGDAAIDVTPKGQFSAGDNVFIGTETIRLDSLASTSSDYETWNVTRGRYLSPDNAHSAGQSIFTRPAYMRLRPMRVWLIERGTASSVVWTGLVATWGTSGAHTTLTIKGRNTLQALKKNPLNAARRKIDTTGETVDISAGSENFTITGVPDGFNWWDPDPSNPADTHLQIGEHIVRCEVRGRDNGSEVVIEQASEVLFEWSRPPIPDNPTGAENTAWQVLVHRRDDLGSGVGAFDQLALGFSSTADNLDTEHVLSIFLAVLLSTGDDGANDPKNSDGDSFAFDILGEDWGMGVSRGLIDFGAWEQAIRQYPADKADQFVWGWNGEKVDLWQTLKGWLRSYNWRIVPDKKGRLIPVKLGDLRIDDGEELAGQSAYLAEAEAPLDGKAEEGLVRVTGEYDGLPWKEAASQETVQAGQTRTLGRDKGQTFDLTFLSRQNDRIRAILENHYAKRREHPPTIEEAMFTREHEDDAGNLVGEAPALAQWLDIRGGASRGLVGPSGGLEDPDDSQVTWVGIVTSRDVDLERYLVQLNLILWMWSRDRPVRLVAPGAVVRRDPSTGATTGSDGTGSWIAYDPSLVPDKDGNTGLMGEDDIRVTRPGGRTFDQKIEIDQVDPNNNQRIYVKSHPSRLPEPGDHLQLVDEGDFANTSWTGASFWNDADLSERRYAYVCDATGTFASGEAGDHYAGI